MLEIICCMLPLILIGVSVLIGCGIGNIYLAYCKYRAKKNRTNHPKLIELEKEREKVCDEYNHWWDEKYGAQKRIDKNFEILKYSTEEVKKKYLTSIEQDRQIHTNADKHMEELRPLVDAAREAEQTYREKYNIRHW